MQIIDNKALLLKVRDPGRITTLIPKSHQLGDHEVLVKWGLEEVQVLKNLGVRNLPSPINKNYDWPGRFKPFHHQRITAEFLTLHRRAFCFNEQGTGKTASAIWAADYLMKLGLIRRVLVLCPLSIMGSAWHQDLFTFAMHRTVTIAHHRNAKQRRKLIEADSDFVVMNYDGLEIAADAIAKDGRFDLVVVDECFVAGTPVKTPDGFTAIEKLRAGDAVLTSNGVKRIKRLVRNTATSLVEVSLETGQKLRCTPDHPFFTDLGWVCAKNLEGRTLISHAGVSYLRRGVSVPEIEMGMGPQEQQTLGADLLEILRAEELPPTEPRELLFQSDAARATGEAIRPQIQGASTEIIRSTETDKTQTQDTRRERNWNDSDRGTFDPALTEWVGLELPSSVGQEAARLSHKLQARFCMAGEANRAGSGWHQSYSQSEAGTGQEEGVEAISVRVVGISYIKPASAVDVYNLEVEGTPNYFVGDGWLAHNCNAFKTATTRRWKVFNKLLRPDMWLWMMTGTPASQSALDAYGLAKLVNPSGVPKFYTGFRDLVMTKITQFKWVEKPTATDIVHKALQPAIRFTKEQCLDLPDMVYVTRDVPLSAQQQKYYDIMRTQMLVEAAGEEISAVNAAAKLTKLLQISAGSVYSDTEEVIDFDCGSRMAALKEVIEESAHKVLVFAQFRHSIQAIANHLRKEGYAIDVIDGSVAPTKRTDIFRRFQNDKDPRILVIQPQAASHGVTLHAADTVVWWSPTTQVETYLQANARAHRAGQKNKVTVVHLQGSPVERRVYKMLGSKINIHEKLVDLYREELRNEIESE